MVLGFHYHVPAVLKNDKIFIPGYLGVFIDSLAPYFEEIVLGPQIYLYTLMLCERNFE